MDHFLPLFFLRFRADGVPGAAAAPRLTSMGACSSRLLFDCSPVIWQAVTVKKKGTLKETCQQRNLRWASRLRTTDPISISETARALIDRIASLLFFSFQQRRKEGKQKKNYFYIYLELRCMIDKNERPHLESLRIPDGSRRLLIQLHHDELRPNSNTNLSAVGFD